VQTRIPPGTPGGLAPVKEKSQDDETNSVISAIIMPPKITKEDTP
jgi:hypothetical protein